MNFWNRFFFALLLGSALGAKGEDGFTFDPQFADHMVLQRGAETMISGSGPPGKSASITFKGKISDKPLVKNIKPDHAGHWRAPLDLASIPTSNSLGDIEISWRKGLSSTSEKLTDVRIGEVWIVAGWEDQGVDGQLTDDLAESDRNSGAIRFWNLNRGVGAAAWPDWEMWPKGADVGRFPNIALRAGVLAALKEHQYIGIVLVRGSDLGKIADPSNIMVPCVLNDPVWLNRGVVRAQDARRKVLNDCKHAGIVTNFLPITNYDAPVFLHYEAFSPRQFPAQVFTFKGAMLPAHAATNRPPSAPTSP